MQALDWTTFLSKNLFSNFDGSYELPYLSNSPQLMGFADNLHHIIEHFFHAAFADGRLENYSSLYNKDYAKVALVEKRMLDGLQQPFAGVDALAKIAGMSPTKLKAIFKSVFGFSMLQYHKEKNLLFARQLVQRSPVQIKIVAAIAGYQTVNKFSAAYKRRFGLLPTADKQTKVN